jgi:hypothetical protein
MANAYVNTLEETFGDVQNFTPEKMQSLVTNTLEYFQGLQEKFAAEDPAIREEALTAALEVKEALEKQMQSLSKLAGVDPSQFDPSREASDQDKQILDEMKKQLSLLRGEKETTPKSNVTKRKQPKLKIVG